MTTHHSPLTTHHSPLTMQTTITGKAYVLGDNVDTDQIIPAQYLTFNPALPEEYRMFGKYALSSVPPSQSGLPKGHVPFHTDDEFLSPYSIIVAGKNFGCGSSREHAPIALNAAGIKAVVAEFYARIFFRNSVNGGYLIPFEGSDRLCEKVCTGDELYIDVAKSLLRNLTTKEEWKLKPLGEVAPILEAGGVFEYARKVGMLDTETAAHK
ncbi:MAG TPA: 3-isopropylmalate dehydratase [Gemmataceae bacterium]|nr:3-isopropylmalate dehydratase [Gemmataceae bacterium]